jgi:hypothetical protein
MRTLIIALAILMLMLAPAGVRAQEAGPESGVVEDMNIHPTRRDEP